MKRIVIDIPEDCSEHTARLIIMDALYEFQSHRGPTPTAYVEARYPRTEGYEWLDRLGKVRQVTNRIIWAERMRNAVDVEKV